MHSGKTRKSGTITTPTKSAEQTPEPSRTHAYVSGQGTNPSGQSSTITHGAEGKHPFRTVNRVSRLKHHDMARVSEQSWAVFTFKSSLDPTSRKKADEFMLCLSFCTEALLRAMNAMTMQARARNTGKCWSWLGCD